MRAMRRLCLMFVARCAARNIARIRNAGRSLPFAVPAIAFVLAACSGGPPITFDLKAAHEFGNVANSRGTLAIYEPSASLPVASQRIVMRTSVDTVAYLKGAQWADRLPALIQMRLIESFENAHSLRAVGRIGLVADYSLQTEIRRFEADVSHGLARVELSARIVGSSGAILTSKIFAAEAPAASDDAATVTAALDEALAKVLRDIVVWVTPKVKV
jgi:cholesterol transport system auxiliary component